MDLKTFFLCNNNIQSTNLTRLSYCGKDEAKTMVCGGKARMRKSIGRESPSFGKH